MATIPIASGTPSVTPVNSGAATSSPASTLAQTPTATQNTPSSAATPGVTSGTPQTQQGTTQPVSGSHNIFNELVFAFVGVGAMAIIANLNERIGRILLAIMIGFLFVWFLLHSGTIAGWVNSVVPQTSSTQLI